jgi:hypothetical protein
MRLVLPVSADDIKKARPGLVWRTDLPFHTAKGALGFRTGWIKPDDAKMIDKHKKAGGKAADIVGEYTYEADLFGEGEGQAWGAPVDEPKPAEEAKGQEKQKDVEEIDSVEDKENGTRAVLMKYYTGGNAGKFGIRLDDTDAGETVPSITFYPNEAMARKAFSKFRAPEPEKVASKAPEGEQSAAMTVEDRGPNKPSVIKRCGEAVGWVTTEIQAGKSGSRVAHVAIDSNGERLGAFPSREKAIAAFGDVPDTKGPLAPQEAANPANSEAVVPSPVADRLPKPEAAPDPGVNSGKIQAELAKPITKTKFRDYGSWSAKGKNLTPAKRATLNQEVAELLMLPSDEIKPEEMDKIRLYSGFGGVKAEGERGVLYDFYTSPPVARMVWKLMNKFAPVHAGAKVLEPSAGTGVFFEAAPDGVDLTGVEFDNRTSHAASLLQPKARIYGSSFEQFNLCYSDRFDAVIGNAPFGDRSVETSFMDEPDEKSLDRYFISRSLDNLAPGGSMALIVHSGVLDNKGNAEWRAVMLRKGQFIGAVRLPDESFKHTGTGVSPDVVMFRAYPDDIRDRLVMMTDEEVKKAGFWDDAFVDGKYYDENPAHRLGRVAKGNFNTEITVGKLAPEDMDRAIEQFSPVAMKTGDDFGKIRELTKGRELPAHKEVEKLAPEEAAAFAAKTLHVGMTKTINGKVYRLNESHRWELMDSDGLTAQKIARAQEYAETIRSIRAALTRDEPIDDLQRQARALLEAYEKDFGTTPKDDGDLKRFFATHPNTTGVAEALVVDMDSDILNKQNIFNKEVEIVDGHKPELTALNTIREYMVDATPETIKAYFPNEADALIEAMWSNNEDVFVTPEGIFQAKEDFLSGDAWQKIDALQAAVDAYTSSEYKRNREKWQAGIQELREAIGWTPIEESDVAPQSSWVPVNIVNKWADDGMGHPAPDGFSYAKNEKGKWGIIASKDVRHYDYKTRNYITDNEGEWREENDPLVYFLNNQKQRGNMDTDAYNEDALENFKSFLANEPEVRKEAEEIFNRLYRNELGSPTKTYTVKLDGWSGKKTLQPHQWQTIHHLYRQGKGISALGTGFGKTLSAVGLFALLRQEGKVKRPLFQVPNNKVKDWVAEFAENMPGLKIGYVDTSARGMSTQEGRLKRYQELASGDYDAIILSESCASEIQLSAEHDQEITDSVAAQITSKKKEGKSERIKIKLTDSAESKLQNGKTNHTITFEDFGCDAIFCDEAHTYKALWSSSLSRETGINDGRHSDRAMAFFKKCEYIRRNHDNKNVFLLTATPMTNSPLEYYNMLYHVAPEELSRLNLNNIDDFINNFAVIADSDDYSWAGGESKTSRKFSGYKNLPTLQSLFFKYTDLQNDPEAIGLKKPTPDNRPNIIDQDEAQVKEVKALAAEIETFSKMTAEERKEKYGGRGFLSFYGDMRTLSLDLELYDPQKYKGWKNPKLEMLADNAANIREKRGGGQVIFCDRVLSGDGTLNMHEKIKASLVARGFKPEEIGIINGITKSGVKMAEKATDDAVQDAIDGFNGVYDFDGNMTKPPKYKILIGTTQTIGEGVNLQKDSSALHHFDIPYRPADFIQRNGRIDRQGNGQEKVELHTYAARGTIDNYSMGLVGKKQNWINQLLRTKASVFLNPDSDGMSMDELLISLSEEFGNAKDATERRALMDTKKKEKDIKDNTHKAYKQLRALSLMRGALSSFKGDKSSREYQNRLDRISNLDSALKRNPEFRYPELLGDKPPAFIYDERNHRVVRMGDIVIKDHKMLRVSGFDYKNREYDVTSMLSGEPVGKMQAATNGMKSFRRDDGGELIPNPSPADVERFTKLSDPKAFESSPREYKESNYDDYMKIHADYGSDSPQWILEAPDGNIGTAGRADYVEGATIINPYSAEGRTKIENGLKTGKLSMSTYEYGISKIHGDVARPAVVHEAKLNRYFADEDNKKAYGAFAKEKKDVEGWVSTDDIANTTGNDAYEIESGLQGHPDLEGDYEKVRMASIINTSGKSRTKISLSR